VIVLPDGVYDAIVVDAGAAEPGPGLTVQLTIIAGEHKGGVVAVTADGWPGDEIDLLGMPATLTVEAGEPKVSIDS